MSVTILHLLPAFPSLDASRMLSLHDPHRGPEAHNAAEPGVGTNDRAILTGQILEDEKILATVLVAFGNNASMGPMVKVPCHADGTLLEPTPGLDPNVSPDRGVPRF